MRWPLSLRSRFLLLVIVGAVAPLAVIGLWLTRTASRAGEDLLRFRIAETLDRGAQEVAGRWPSLRSELINFTESAPVQRALTEPRGTVEPTMAGLDECAGALSALGLYDFSGNRVWSETYPGGATAGGRGPGLLVRLPVFAEGSPERLGTLEAELGISLLLGDAAVRTSSLGTVLAAFDPVTGASLLPLPFDAELLEAGGFSWGGDDWVTDRRVLTEPPIILVAAAPLSPLTAPFDAAARQGLLVLLVVAGLVIIIAVFLTGRMTRSLERLAAAAEAVSRGELDRRVEATGQDEIGRVARTFNTMTESLRHTLRELADRQALAAVGEFAASLSHEVRNALTSIRLDLQVSGEQLPDEAAVKEPHQRALQEIGRLNETVTGALELARSGHLKQVQLDLWAPLHAAVHAAWPEFAERGARLNVPEAGTPIMVTGDPAALEQLFLNLLLNAAQALDEGGEAAVMVEPGDEQVTIRIRDEGPGIRTEALDRVFEAFYSTREGGTGLGLPIARRIAQAHGGQLRVHSAAGAGTEVEIVLPLAM
jgi:signal transduction histidine kinase